MLENFSAPRLLAEPQDHVVRRGQGAGRDKRENATAKGRTADPRKRGETRYKATGRRGRQAGPLHAPAPFVSHICV